MTPERWLPLLTVICCLLGNALLSMGEHNSQFTLLMFCAAPLALLFADFLGWLRLNRVLANVGALLAVAKAVYDFFTKGLDQQLLVIGDLLICLQLVLLFQQKHQRSYWQLLVLSLLQVVVAAAMNLHLQFGALLVVYMAFALLLLSWQFTFYEAEHLRRRPRSSLHLITAEDTLFVPVSWLATSAERSVDDVAADPASAADPAVAAEPASATDEAALASSAVWHVLPQRGGALRIGQVFWPIAVVGTLSLLLSVTIFYAVPRGSGTAWRGGSSVRQQMTGYTRTVSLDQMGEILQSNALALRLTLQDPNQPTESYVVLGQPYLRGAAYVNYRKKTWEPAQLTRSENRGPNRYLSNVGVEVGGPKPRVDSKQLPRPPRGINRPVIHQHIQQEITGDASLFTIYPGYRLEQKTPGEIYYDPNDTSLFRHTTEQLLPSNTYNYWIGTTGLENGRQQNIAPVELDPGALDPTDAADRFQAELEECSRFDPAEFPEIAKTAAAVVSFAKLDKEQFGRLSIIRALELHFFDPRSGYQYSLNIPRPPSADIDPLEWFVAESKSGHCEFFASAMVMMLRSQGIPARLVLGYHGGEFNTVGNFYSIRQRDAHAWVEAYLRPEDMQEEGATEILGPQPKEGFPKGGWLRIDPTPGAREDAIATSWKDHIEQLVDYLQFLWSDYVLDTDSDRQRRRAYESMTDRVFGQWNQWLSRDNLLNLLGQFAGTSGRTPGAILAALGRRFGPLASLILAVGLLIFYRRHLPRTLRYGLDSLVQRWRGRSRRHSQVDFYERVERALALRGIYRDPATTPREFLSRCVPLEPAQEPDMAPALAKLADAFYRVRYGQAQLDAQQRQQLEEAVLLVEAYATQST